MFPAQMDGYDRSRRCLPPVKVAGNDFPVNSTIFSRATEFGRIRTEFWVLPTTCLVLCVYDIIYMNVISCMMVHSLPLSFLRESIEYSKRNLFHKAFPAELGSGHY